MIPVVIVHEGYKEYVKINVEITGKNNKIFLIGDKSLEHLGNIENVTFVDIDKYKNDKKINKYEEHFTNYSSNASNFEFICYRRVFIIKLYMEENNIDKVFHIDSDNVLLKNINDYDFKENNAYMIPTNWHTNRMSNSIHCGLLTKEFATKFENLYEDIYINKSKLNLIKDKIKYHTNTNGGYINGGICDMTLYYLLNKENLIKVDNLMRPKDIGNKKVVFINNINNGEGLDSKEQYETHNNIMKIQRGTNGVDNYVYDKVNKEYVVIMNIHFQGGAKALMNETINYNLETG